MLRTTSGVPRTTISSKQARDEQDLFNINTLTRLGLTSRLPSCPSLSDEGLRGEHPEPQPASRGYDDPPRYLQETPIPRQHHICQKTIDFPHVSSDIRLYVRVSFFVASSSFAQFSGR
jgi:hypothetical protein